jgi:hypothetical protein
MAEATFVEQNIPWYLKEVKPTKAADGTLWRTYKVRAIARPYFWVKNLISRRIYRTA